MPGGAVIIGGFVNGLGLVRALAARGVPCAVVTTKPYDVAQHSRWVVARARISGLEDEPDVLLEPLERRISEWKGWALFPTNDESLAALAIHGDRLRSMGYVVLAPPWEVARSFVDKKRMHEAAVAVGLDLPHHYGPVEEALAATDLRFPALVKPIIGHRLFARMGCKLFVAHDRDDLRRAAACLAEAGTPGQVFDFVPGPDSELYAHATYVDAKGEPSEGVTIRKIRQSPPLYGVARVAEIARDTAGLREATIELLRRMGHRGFASAEFKRDPRDGRYRFIEVNGRSVIFNSLLREAGLDFAALAWSEAMEGRPIRVEPRPWPGAWIHLHADVLYAALWRRHHPLSGGEFFAPYRREKIFAVWSARDPAPFFAEWWGTGRDLVAALVRGDQSVLVDRTRPEGRAAPGSADASASASAPVVAAGEPSALPVAAGLSETTARNFSP